MALDSFEISSQTRRSIYPVWLRFFTLIAAIAAGLILFGPTLLLSSSDKSLPWNEENRILLPDKNSEIKPNPEQPQLTRILRYKTQVGQEDNPCGTINFMIDTDGSVKGVWNGEYDRPSDKPVIRRSLPRPHQEPNTDSNLENQSESEPNNIHCLIMAASFYGNIDPSRPFIENGSRNRSNLYFITRGAFTMLETQQSTGKSRSVFGSIYVRGWLDPNYTAVGEVIITENKRSFDTFDWAAQPAN